MVAHFRLPTRRLRNGNPINQRLPLSGIAAYARKPMPEPIFERATIRVPATSANLGPGFDCIGVALDLWNETIVTRGNTSFKISGHGAESLPRDDSNVIASSAAQAFRELDVAPIPLAFDCRNKIPLARGLGSSSAATLTGIAAAFAFAGLDVSDKTAQDRIFEIAADIEGHPDNVAPAVYGGCQIGIHVENIENSYHQKDWIVSRVGATEDLKAVLFIPDFTMATEEARGILPNEVSRSDAVFNVGRAAMLVHALETRQWNLLRHATDDRLHQPQRIEKLFPRFHPIARGALDAGAHGVFLSGAGPAVMALASDRFMTICYEMSENARKAQVDGKALILDIVQNGLQVKS